MNIEPVTESALGLRQQTDEARSVKKTGLNVLFLAERVNYTIKCNSREKKKEFIQICGKIELQNHLHKRRSV